MVTIGGSDKMAKSIGNVLDVERAVELHGPNAIRMWLLQSHYSQPIEYSGEILEEKRRSFERLRNLYGALGGSTSSSELSDRLANELTGRFDAAMQDDLNTPEAVAALFDVAGRAGREVSARPEAVGEFGSLARAMEDVMTVFGFDLPQEHVEEVDGISIDLGALVPSTTASQNRDRWVRGPMPNVEILEKVASREKARQAKDWATADRLRDELHADGWVVEDTAQRPILRRR
jgi:cysteinyl-tRNA synthetase